MTDILLQAYRNIFGSEPDTSLHEWELAQAIMLNWNVPVLGEDLARECIFRIVNHTEFPDSEITQKVVGPAEDKALELFPELQGIDPHMDVIAHLERQYHERGAQEAEHPNIK